ncbi:MAG: XRE family transcriptional regulator [Solirubrobacteraceae bacterium]|jgi:transcriptional regulator with XRE-family HTH domain
MVSTEANPKPAESPARKGARSGSAQPIPTPGGADPAVLAGKPSAQAGLGARVKALRESSSLSLRDLAIRSGVSAPMLSQVERGETSPTLTVAARIASGLELRLSQLLRLDEDGAVTVVRADQRRRGGNARRGHRFEVMTSAQPGQRAELSRHTLAPGGATGAADDPPMHEPGSRETALVERGSVVLVCDGQRHELCEGDCVTFDADLPHHFENRGPAQASFLAVVSAGLRRS